MVCLKTIMNENLNGIKAIIITEPSEDKMA